MHIYFNVIIYSLYYFFYFNFCISVVCFIDSKNISGINEIKTIKPGQKIEDIDAIIITPVLEYKEIAESLEKFYDCYMISLESVLMNADCELI